MSRFSDLYSPKEVKPAKEVLSKQTPTQQASQKKKTTQKGKS